MAEPKPVDRRRRRHEATKAEIVRAAWKLAERDGVGALTLAEVAAEVEMSPQSIYGYFRSKDDIYDAMFRDASTSIRTHMMQPVDAIDGSRAGVIETFTDRYLDFCLGSPARFQLLFQRPVPGFTPSAESMGVAAELLAWAVATLAEAGIDDPQLVLIALGSLAGLVNFQIANQVPDDVIRALARRAIALFLAGMEFEQRH